MRNIYIWQQKDWPQFRWDDARIFKKLTEVRYVQGRLTGTMCMLGMDMQSRAMLDTLTTDIVKSSEIEGELLNDATVRSSVARHLGIELEGLPESDRSVEGIVQITIDAARKYTEPLTFERLWNWHAALFPTGRSGMYSITVGNWRQGEEPMQVVSGAMGKEKVHYQAPGSSDVPAQMERFIAWANREQPMDMILKAAIAHLWFVSIHPFDDGNGRLARVITDLFLARSDRMPHRYYSMSAQIRKIRGSYYETLEYTQKYGMDITPWLSWFLDCLHEALLDAENTVKKVREKALFWERHREVAMNPRQTQMVNLLWDGFEGKLTSSKWGKITKCSADTALRDIQDLIGKGVFRKSAESGRSTNYELNL